jgi:hypothetical protein
MMSVGAADPLDPDRLFRSMHDPADRPPHFDPFWA